LEILKTYLGIPEDKQLPGTLCLAPHFSVGDKAFPLKTYLMRPYPGSQIKGDNEKSIFNYQLSQARGVVEKCIWNIKPEISNLSEDPTIIARECGQHFLLYVFFWVIPLRLNFICRRFGTLCSIFIGNLLAYEDGTDRVFRNVGI